jgi:hypothetical protein
MNIVDRLPPRGLPSGYLMAPIHRADAGTPLRICVLVNPAAAPPQSPFLLLRELPGSSVYLGAVCDAAGKVESWVELWLQTLELKDSAISGYHERLTNEVFDQRWRAEYALWNENAPDLVIASGMEADPPGPILIPQSAGQPPAVFLASEATHWRVCQDDALLKSFGLPPYATSPFRYLHEPGAGETKTFLATTADAPTNSHVQSLDRLRSLPKVQAIFNPHGGLIRITRFSPLLLEDYLQILEGQTWPDSALDPSRMFPGSAYAALQAWSAKPVGLPFLLHGSEHSVERLHEVFFLKLSTLLNLFREVRNHVKTRQLPLLNLSPASFRTYLTEAGDPFPALWATRSTLARPGQAYPLKIKTTEQNYFLRLGKIEPSPFLPEGLATHVFGVGSVRIRNVAPEMDGIVLEGTMVAQDYLSLDPYDLLWFKLPLGEERLEFYAHVYPSENVGPREARFKTVPSRQTDTTTAALKGIGGAVFPKSPYEIWPLLSSPCDLYSLGVLAVRILLANYQSNLPVILDEVLSLSRRLGENSQPGDDLPQKLTALLEKDKHLSALIHPGALTGTSQPGTLSKTAGELWLETMTLILRFFPGTGPHSFCKDFGDVSPLALESIFDRPIQDLESIVWRLRSLLAPSLTDNEEIAEVLLRELASL